MKRKTVGGTERDAFSRNSKNALKWERGERKAIKAGANRRDRRETRQELRNSH